MAGPHPLRGGHHRPIYHLDSLACMKIEQAAEEAGIRGSLDDHTAGLPHTTGMVQQEWQSAARSADSLQLQIPGEPRVATHSTVLVTERGSGVTAVLAVDRDVPGLHPAGHVSGAFDVPAEDGTAQAVGGVVGD